MSKKQFEQIASILLASKPDPQRYFGGPAKVMHNAAVDYWRETVERFADWLAGTNTRFDKDRFFAACGYEVKR